MQAGNRDHGEDLGGGITQAGIGERKQEAVGPQTCLFGRNKDPANERPRIREVILGGMLLGFGDVFGPLVSILEDCPVDEEFDRLGRRPLATEEPQARRLHTLVRRRPVYRAFPSADSSATDTATPPASITKSPLALGARWITNTSAMIEIAQIPVLTIANVQRPRMRSAAFPVSSANRHSPLQALSELSRAPV